MEIVAKSVTLIDDGYCTVLSFADDPEDPRQFAILQITNEPTTQDLQLEQGGVHLELAGHKVNGYDLIKSIDAGSNEIFLLLDDEAAQRAGIGVQVKIMLQDSLISGMTIAQAVEPFRQRLPRPRG